LNIYNIMSLYDIIAIWSLLFINVLLSIGGFIYYMRSAKSDGHKKIDEYPFVSILVPAHNESVVIVKTMQSLLKLEYPQDRCEIIVINDNSSDNSSEALKEIQRNNQHRKIMIVNTDCDIGGRGKSNALNIGLSLAKGTVIAVYDADNTPEPDSLILLVENLIADEGLGAVIGKFRTRNRNASIFTRFINIETLAYQCMNQAGRCFFFKLCTIPGTNFVVRRDLLEAIGGWDTKALAEDTEVSFRIYRMGYKIKFLPQSVTWEQEPQQFKIWYKQRTRWAKGNLYVIKENFKYIFDRSAGIMRLDIIYYVAIYVLMLSSLIFSDVIFVLGLLGIAHSTLGGFSTLLWVLAIILFVLNVLITLAIEKNEFNLESGLLIFIMLFTYAKLWVLVVLNAAIQTLVDTAFERETKWYKTERFAEAKGELTIRSNEK
jgi:cellulose synthase/poly-beta-1,6-N-acetylglucosamine synthase-like glycosyltransferase